MRALIIASDGYHDKRIERILTNNNINGDIVKKLTRNMLNVYNCVIFSYKNDIPNLPKVIEAIVLEKNIHVIFINNSSSISHYYNLMDDLHFSMIQDYSLEIALPITIGAHSKYVQKIVDLKEQLQESKDEIELMKLTNKAKLVLMKKGLSEAKSHKFIQQKAMSMRISKLKLVNLIIENKIDI